MWPWRQSGPSNYPLWFKLVWFSCALHIIALLLLFVAYRGYYAQYRLDIIKNVNAPIIFMPLHKTAQSIGQTNNGNNKQAATMSNTSVQPAPKILPKPKAATAIVQDKKIAPKKTNKDKQRSEQKKKKELEKKKQAEKLKKKKKEVAKPKEEAKPAEIPQEPQKVDSPAVSSSQNAAASGANQEAIYVGQVEWEALQLQEAIQQEVAQHWKPPAGLANDLQCTIKVVIDWQGNSTEVVVQEKSGVLAFDIHARSAITAMHFPKTAWGKELIINFKQ